MNEETIFIPIKCPNCNGYGTIGRDRLQCPACKGKGIIVMDKMNGEIKNYDYDGSQKE